MALLGSLPTSVLSQRLPIAVGNGNFSAEALVRGSSATAEQCRSIPDAVWAGTESGHAECVRFWASGVTRGRPNARVLIYLTGDQLAFDQPAPGYTARNPELMQSAVDGMAARAAVPVILAARPGTFGSSGEHQQRRRRLESQLMSAALDELKRRYGIRELVLVGLSGGGHVVASLLGWRSDIVCAVPTSSVSSPRLRWEAMGRTTDLTGHADSYEPLLHLEPALMHPGLRVFVLGDPEDRSVQWSTQTPLAARLKELGVAVELLTGQGSDPQRHDLGESGRRVGALCLRDRSTPEILDVAARGLKG